VPRSYELTLGLPHTNYRGLSEPLLLMQAGHFQWAAIAAAIGRPLSRLRTATGGEVYAAFYFIEERIPPSAPLESFGLDDDVRFVVSLRAFKNIVIEGQISFDHVARLAPADPGDPDAAAHPWIRFGNIFITPEAGNSRLRVAPPAGVDLSALPLLPNDENPYHLTREAEETGRLGVLTDAWTEVGTFEHTHPLDVDRDTNGAGLIYFANYVTFMEAAERRAVAAHAGDLARNSEVLARRSLRHRRIAYYGNADVTDRIIVRVNLLTNRASPELLGVRTQVVREQDGQLICLSECLKTLPTVADLPDKRALRT
jgi:probable biosynthetic protein (TIGR04098 family)